MTLQPPPGTHVGCVGNTHLMEPETEDGNDRVEAKVDEEHIIVPLPAILWGPRTRETQKEVRADESQTAPQARHEKALAADFRWRHTSSMSTTTVCRRTAPNIKASSHHPRSTQVLGKPREYSTM